MRKFLVLLFVCVLGFSGVAQPAKKLRNTASNTKEAVTERAVSSRFNQGLRYYYTAQYEDALQTFSGILSDAPKHAPSYFMLYRVYARRQQYSEAENMLEQAVKLDKGNIWYQLELARAYVKEENYKKAAPMLEKVCCEIPDNSDYLSLLVLCYSKIGASEKAAKAQSRLEVLIKQDSAEEQLKTNPEVSGGGETHIAQGLAALKAQQYELAVSHFEQALQEDDTDYDLWSAFAEAVSKSGQWHRLTLLEEDMTTLFPQSSTLLSALADSFLHDGQPNKAVEYFKQALAFAFDADQIQFVRNGLYNAYMQIGDAENAARYR